MLLANRQQQDIELKLNDGNLNRDIWRLIVHKLVKDVFDSDFLIWF